MANDSSTRGPRSWRWVFWLIFILTALFLVAQAIFPGASNVFDSEPVADFSEGWYLLQVGEKGPLLSLPTQLDLEGTVRIAKTIPDDIPYPTVLSFRSAHQKLRLFADGELMYSFGYDEKALFGQSPGSTWNMVRLPADAAGEELILEMSTPYSSYEGQIPAFYVGSKAASLFSILRENFFSFLLTLAIFISGLVMLLVYFLVMRKDATAGKELLYLGLFSFFISLWLFGEGRLTQFFGIPPAFNTCTTVLAMLATPIPLIYFIACHCDALGRKIMKVLARAMTALLALSLLLQATGLWDFILQMPFVNTCIALGCAVILLVVIHSRASQPSQGLTRLLVSMGILALCFILETIKLYMGGVPIGGSMRLGVLIFIMIQAASAFKNASQIVVMSRFASVDALTGCENRAAYIQWMEEVAEEKNVGIVIADINNLKFINDTMGHDLGDDAIIRCANCFAEAFSSGGRCFRIGGDEFAMLGSYLSEERLDELSRAFYELGKNQAQMVDYPLSVSCGHTMYDPQKDPSLAEAISRADKLMYKNKRLTKQAEERRKAMAE